MVGRGRSGLGGTDTEAAELRARHTVQDDGYGGMFRSQDAREAWKVVMGPRLAREAAARQEAEHEAEAEAGEAELDA